MAPEYKQVEQGKNVKIADSKIFELYSVPIVSLPLQTCQFQKTDNVCTLDSLLIGVKQKTFSGIYLPDKVNVFDNRTVVRALIEDQLSPRYL